MKKIITIIVCILLVAVVIAVGFIATRPQKNDTAIKTLKVNEVTRSVFYAPQYVAIANGFFEEEGLKIELTTGQGADNVMTAVLAGQCDIGFCGPEASIYVYNEGKEDYVEVFAELTKRDGSFLVSKNKTNIAVTDKIIILANSIKITVIILHSIFNFIYKKSAIGTSPTAG